APPQLNRLRGRDQARRGLRRCLDEAGDCNPQCIGDAAEGGHAGVGTPLCDLHQHPLAHAGFLGQLVEREVAGAADQPEIAGNSAVDGGYIVHGTDGLSSLTRNWTLILLSRYCLRYHMMRSAASLASKFFPQPTAISR